MPVYPFINELHSQYSENFSNKFIYTILIQGISFIFTGQRPNFLVFKKVHSMLALKFSTVLPPSVRIFKNYKARFKAAKYLHTHSFYSTDEFFYM